MPSSFLRVRVRLAGVRGVRDEDGEPRRRGAAYGALLAALDTGIGTGSSGMGGLIQRYGFRVAFGVAAAISALAIPYFLVPIGAGAGRTRMRT